MSKVTAVQINTLMTYFSNTWADLYGSKPVMNRNRDKWAFQSMIEDLGMDRCKEVITYWVETSRPGQPLRDLLYSYDQLDLRMRDREEDRERIARMLKETKDRVEKWKAEQGGK